MIHDARSNPNGFRLRIDQWPRDPHVRRIARSRGFRIPAPNFVAAEATPARAFLNHGVWRAWCPDCAFAAEDVWKDHGLFWCMKCGNAGCGGSWRPLVWPENVAEIEAALDPFPAPAQNWEPWGPSRDLTAEAAEWVEHAQVMIDPEHGLTSNEVGGADDPETYTTPVVAVTNAIIASSDANVDKGDIRYFRQYLSADPAGAGYWPVSSSSSAAGWVARLTALADAFASGTVNSALTISGAFASLSATIGASGLVVSGLALLNGGISSTTATLTGLVQALRFESTVATGTAPLTVASTTEVANLNASRVAGKIPTATPAAAALPLANGSGKLDAWVSAAFADAMVNGTLAFSVAGSALTIALKTSAGADPSAVDPVTLLFRSATAANGDYAAVSVTAATSLVVSSGSTLGTTSSQAFRLWVVAFNDGGTARLGVINCRSGTTIYPLSGWGIASSTAEGGAGGSDSAQAFYTGTAVAAKAFTVLGYATWESGLGTAGTWSAGPTRAALFRAQTPLPGHEVQAQENTTGAVATGTTVMPDDDTIPQITEGDQYMTQAITPTSAANLLLVEFRGQFAISAADNVVVALFQDAVANALAAIIVTVAAIGYSVQPALSHAMLAATTSATTFRIRAGQGGVNTVTFNGAGGTRRMGGVMASYLRAREIMA